jgi:hypothetical protein
MSLAPKSYHALYIMPIFHTPILLLSGFHVMKHLFHTLRYFSEFYQNFLSKKKMQVVSKRALQCYSKCYCAASVTKTFTVKGVQTIHRSTSCKVLFWNSLHYQWKSHLTVITPGKIRCVLLYHDGSEHCTYLLNKCTYISFQRCKSLIQTPYSYSVSTKKLNSVALVRERTIPNERPPLVGEVVPTVADRVCRVVTATDPHFLDRNLFCIHSRSYFKSRKQTPFVSYINFSRPAEELSWDWLVTECNDTDNAYEIFSCVLAFLLKWLSKDLACKPPPPPYTYFLHYFPEDQV